MILSQPSVHVLGRRKREAEFSPGVRYRRRDAPYMVWEVITAYTGTDGKPYVVLVNLSDPTWRKTLSLAELESGSQYIRLPRI
jgi:hypothetical protein